MPERRRYTPPPPTRRPEALRRGLMPEPPKPLVNVSVEETTDGWLVAVDGDPILRTAPKSFSRQTVIRAARDGLLAPYDPPAPFPRLPPSQGLSRRALTIIGLAVLSAVISAIAALAFIYAGRG